MNYRKPEFGEMDKIAQVHMKCFEGYFLTSFGEKLIQKYYEEFFREKELFVIAEEDGAIIGFVMGYLKGSRARSNFEKNNRRELAKNLIIRCLKFDKLAIKKCFAKLINILKKTKTTVSNQTNEENIGDLLSICVLPQWRGNNVAGEIVKKFEDLLKENGVTTYTLSVLKDNMRARRFYEKLGFEICRESKDEVKYIKNIGGYNENSSY